MRKDLWNIIKNAAAFMAWVIGSGFATGQEILQFFGSFSLMSIPSLIINLIGFAVIGAILLCVGYDNRHDGDFEPYEYYCGKYIGKLYAVLVPVTIFLLIAVLISGAAAALNQYYSVNIYIGAGIMGGMLLASYFIGFEKMIQIVSGISPIVIAFAILVGSITVFRDASAFDTIAVHTEELSRSQNSPTWWISSLLYIALNFFCGSKYYTSIGMMADNKKIAIWGSILGSVILILTIGFMDFAIMLNAGDLAGSSVPTLILAQKISPIFGAVFSVILILGIFSSSATMVWSFCSSIFKNNKTLNAIYSVTTIVTCTALGFVPFGNLIGIVYPLMGYLGLFFIGAVAYKGLRKKH